MWSGLRLISSVSARSLAQIEQFAMFDEQKSRAKVGLVGETEFYRDGMSALSKYVSLDLLASLVHACEQQSEALRQRSVTSLKKLKLTSYLVQRRCVQARHIRALDQLHLDAYEWDTLNTKTQLEIGAHAKELYRQLTRHQEEWALDEGISEVCTRACQLWEFRATASAQVREQLEKNDYADYEYEQRQVRLWKELLDERMSLYRVPLDDTAAVWDTTVTRDLPKSELNEILADVPSLPEYPPWRVTPRKRLANHVFIVLVMILLVFGIGMSVLQMAINGISFSTVSGILFFVFWMVFFAQRWIRR